MAKLASTVIAMVGWVELTGGTIASPRSETLMGFACRGWVSIQTVSSRCPGESRDPWLYCLELRKQLRCLRSDYRLVRWGPWTPAFRRGRGVDSVVQRFLPSRVLLNPLFGYLSRAPNLKIGTRWRVPRCRRARGRAGRSSR